MWDEIEKLNSDIKEVVTFFKKVGLFVIGFAIGATIMTCIALTIHGVIGL